MKRTEDPLFVLYSATFTELFGRHDGNAEYAAKLSLEASIVAMRIFTARAKLKQGRKRK